MNWSKSFQSANDLFTTLVRLKLTEYRFSDPLKVAKGTKRILAAKDPIAFENMMNRFRIEWEKHE